MIERTKIVGITPNSEIVWQLRLANVSPDDGDQPNPFGGKDVVTATCEECQTLVDTYNRASSGIDEFYLYEGVYHAFNNPDDTTLGGTRIVRGQNLLTQYNAKATELAQHRSLEFLAKQFANRH